ncbi:MAG TPA: cytochrome c biogenesis protein CcsA, partial [Kofleriaceae bacterium]|nr:cytochrome c biogenesis protein CcsA [Kofleriaceae bacterium]
MRHKLFWPVLAVCGVLFPLTLYLIFHWAPIDQKLLFSQKIFYWHVPNAMMLFATVFVCGIASILYLRKRKPEWDDVAGAAGALGVMLGAITLVSGSIWGRAAWGVWWQWDQRLTTSLLLWMLMVGYVLVRTYGGAGSERLAAGLAIFAMADVPLIYLSVFIWKTVHPKASVVPTLGAHMRVTFWLSVLLFLLF